MSKTILPYVSFLSYGTYGFGINYIVFDPTTMLTTPCAIMPTSLEKDLCQTIFSPLLTKCIHYCANPVLVWMTAFMSSFLG